jgi:hypothetical protein
MGIVWVYELATLNLIARGPWGKAGFEFERRDGTTYPFVKEGKIRASLEFAGVWGINYPDDRLWPRRGQQAWEWLKHHFSEWNIERPCISDFHPKEIAFSPLFHHITTDDRHHISMQKTMARLAERKLRDYIKRVRDCILWCVRQILHIKGPLWWKNIGIPTLGEENFGEN